MQWFMVVPLNSKIGIKSSKQGMGRSEMNHSSHNIEECNVKCFWAYLHGLPTVHAISNYYSFEYYMEVSNSLRVLRVLLLFLSL